MISSKNVFQVYTHLNTGQCKVIMDCADALPQELLARLDFLENRVHMYTENSATINTLFAVFCDTKGSTPRRLVELVRLIAEVLKDLPKTTTMIKSNTPMSYFEDTGEIDITPDGQYLYHITYVGEREEE